MEDSITIQTRISSLEQHLEEVRKRAKELLVKESRSSTPESLSISAHIGSYEPAKEMSSSSDSFSSSEAESVRRPQQYYAFQYPYPNYYQNYYPQQDFRQQVEYLHYQLSQNQQHFSTVEKNLMDENKKLKDIIYKQDRSENNKNNQENYKIFKEKSENYENRYRSLESEHSTLEQKYRNFEERYIALEGKYQKLKSQVPKRQNHDKAEVTSKEEAHKHEIKRYTEKISSLENKISSDRIAFENYKKDLNKAEDKVANLEDLIIETRNSYTQINKRLSAENDSLRKQLSFLTKTNEIKDSDEIRKLKLQIIQRNKEIEHLKQAIERNTDEEQPKPIEIKASKRKNVPKYSEKIESIKRKQHKQKKQKRQPSFEIEESKESEITEENEPTEENEEYEQDETNEAVEDEFKEDYRPPTLENQLIHLQIEKQKLENEYIKLPEFSRNLASKLRKTEVETELENITKTISCVKSKLRSLNLI